MKDWEKERMRLKTKKFTERRDNEQIRPRLRN
jgi:hypothetical protein